MKHHIRENLNLAAKKDAERYEKEFLDYVKTHKYTLLNCSVSFFEGRWLFSASAEKTEVV